MRDQDTIRRFDLLELSRQDYWTILQCGFLIGLLSAVGVGMVGAMWHGEPLLFDLLPPVLGVVYMVWMVWLANRRLNPEQRRRLSTQRELVRREQGLRASRDSASFDMDAAKAQANKLRDLALRMKRLDLAALGEQIEQAEAAADLLERRVRVDRELIARYGHECELLTAKIDALDIATAGLPGALASRLAELEALEEELETVRRIRDAELELSKYLREEAA